MTRTLIHHGYFLILESPTRFPARDLQILKNLRVGGGGVWCLKNKVELNIQCLVFRLNNQP